MNARTPGSDPIYKRIYAAPAMVADRLAGALAAEADPERLAAVGEAIVRCATGRRASRFAHGCSPVPKRSMWLRFAGNAVQRSVLPSGQRTTTSSMRGAAPRPKVSGSSTCER